ncbi:double-strand break repair protein AddB [Paraurantiacibacter namhicola]|uniref:ATP-dependent helicase/deoxyribonuclease subunit B n=1 Tax=Paraurantiacibacter namhicola TaxID=645517 RepID=A0A1C7D9Q3_9SPHN|nr:double-strand break repair protein AddB [Paraurantiacibacter namhicola]ANU08178.1 ATP-dependent helicase/deoxyribonuclease subunit B [Paraurantiacibacter namhicola]
MAERQAPQVYSIAAHRGFADALVAGLLPRYAEDGFGLARLTLLLPSSRAARTLQEAFIRLSGAADESGGLLMPRMAVVGDLDLDETLGPLLDPLGMGAAIPPAADPQRRWFRIAQFMPEACRKLGREVPPPAARLRLAREVGAALDRLQVENIDPGALWEERVAQVLAEMADHWKANTALFHLLVTEWQAELRERGEVDAATRRNRLFAHAAERWRANPPETPIVAAGVTSAAPELANLLRVVSELPRGAVVLPDLDLSMDDAVWTELGSAGDPDGETLLGAGDAVTHPQYHLKLLLNRMGVNRGEVQQWHRAGLGKGPPERSHAISNLFLPPEASKGWVDLEAKERRLSGVRIMNTANPEHEAQSIALLVRQAIAEPERRVAVVTPDRSLAQRVVHHLRRWNIAADDSAGRPLSQTVAGRLFLLLADAAAQELQPVPLMALLQHPYAGGQDAEAREAWLRNARLLDRKLRGPRPAPGLEPLRAHIASIVARGEDGARGWWAEVEAVVSPLLALGAKESAPLSEIVDTLVACAEQLCGTRIWAREDGRTLSRFVGDMQVHARECGPELSLEDAVAVLREAMDAVAVRPPFGGHPRVAIYGLLEARMTRADLVICAGLNEGTWPGTPATDPLLAPPLLRALGVPGGDFRIGLSAHDLAGLLGAPEVVLSRAARNAEGPAIPSRFLLRVQALLGDLLKDYRETDIPELAEALDYAPPAEAYPRPEPKPSSVQRQVAMRATSLDNLRSDPYQFYANAILGLSAMEGLDEEPSAAWKGTAAHEILKRWHENGGRIEDIADAVLAEENAHPLMAGLWRPRLVAALEWVVQEVSAQDGRKVLAWEEKGEWMYRGVTIRGRVDRVDRLVDGSLAIVDYKTGGPPSGKMVEQGYALQLGIMGLMAQGGAFDGVEGDPAAFEYWSLAKKADQFGYVASPVKENARQSGLPLEDFLPVTKAYLDDAIDRWIAGNEAFTARLNPDVPVYNDYDQLMRLDEWFAREDDANEEGDPA